MSNAVEGASGDAPDMPGDLGPLADDVWTEAGVALPALPADSAVLDGLLYPGDVEGREAALAGEGAPALAGDGGDFAGALPAGGAEDSVPFSDEALGLVPLDHPSAADLSAVFDCDQGLAGVAPAGLRNLEEDTEPESVYSGASDAATAATETTEDAFDDRLNALADQSATLAASPPVADTAPASTPALVAAHGAVSTGSGKRSANTTPSKPRPSPQTGRRRSSAADAAQDDADANAVDLLAMVFSDADLRDDGYLLSMCAATAEASKQTLRDSLKDRQREEEAAASGSGTPLTSAQKERTRSRRESAVTRRRAEVYLRQLEAIVRQVPALQRALAARLDGGEGLTGDLARFSPRDDAYADANSGGGGGEETTVAGLSPGTARVSHDLERLGLGFDDNNETGAVGEADEGR